VKASRESTQNEADQLKLGKRVKVRQGERLSAGKGELGLED